MTWGRSGTIAGFFSQTARIGFYGNQTYIVHCTVCGPGIQIRKTASAVTRQIHQSAARNLVIFGIRREMSKNSVYVDMNASL